jgi:hypothetical protein
LIATDKIVAQGSFIGSLAIIVVHPIFKAKVWAFYLNFKILTVFIFGEG